MIGFATPRIESEFHNRLKPPCRAIVYELQRWLLSKGWPGIMITGVSRTDAAMLRIYGAGWKKKGRFSWHLVDRAVDIRTHNWTGVQHKQIFNWLKRFWPQYEIILHDVGQGYHLHIAAPAPLSMFRRLRRWKTARNEAKKGRLKKAV